MRTIKTYSKGAPFYNAFLRRNQTSQVEANQERRAAWGVYGPRVERNGVPFLVGLTLRLAYRPSNTVITVGTVGIKLYEPRAG
jgi:hypothetical protein